MNATALAKHYSALTPEERFRLILAASGRGDEAERERLARAGQRLTLSMQDHAPFAHAYKELAHLMYIDLMETVALYFDGFRLVADEARNDEVLDFDDDKAEDVPEAEAAKDDSDELSSADLTRGLILAVGFMLKTKADGWKRFCERLNVPPFLFWRHLPGFHRLQRALALAKGTDSLPGTAFVHEWMVRFFNRARAAGEPEVTADGLMTAEKIADKWEEAYHQRAKWWSG